jgi:hypothetical protein
LRDAATDIFLKDGRESQFAGTPTFDAALANLGFGSDERPGVLVVRFDECMDVLLSC